MFIRSKWSAWQDFIRSLKKTDIFVGRQETASGFLLRGVNPFSVCSLEWKYGWDALISIADIALVPQIRVQIYISKDYNLSFIISKRFDCLQPDWE